MRDDHVPELDGLRALAALAVLVVHTSILCPEAHWHTAFARWSRGGWLGVDLFFALSGYLITRNLLGLREGPRYYAPFYARRIARIFPLYYLYLALVFAVTTHAHLPRHLYDLAPADWWMFFLFVGNLPAASEQWPGILLAPLWSLAVEEQFYAAWPLLVRRRSIPALLGVCAGAAVVALGMRGLAETYLGESAPYVLALCRIDALLAGAAVALLAHVHGGARVAAWCRAHVAEAVTWLVVVALTPLGPRFVQGVYPSTAYTLVGYAVTALACAVIVGSVAHGAPPVPWLRVRPLVYVGRISYGVYVLHAAVGAGLYALAPTAWRSWSLEVWTLAIAGATVLVATAVHHLVERPALALTRRPSQVTSIQSPGRASRETRVEGG